ncbi:hypothetical protein CKM354_001246300 [Cercospora kikuchii]|uniref:BHLH domain-containing protein n=1 Tax=Cercospora kikuchii TaxID=84275 RepID=A0A9P3FM14_9PEZI|nr:uncharacterized protein CKM354_001246300 [Cercospora kikuchii]GIZ49433.1 hypothetical protein CKM354_001246300 [Cercospora kikuchii]
MSDNSSEASHDRQRRTKRVRKWTKEDRAKHRIVEKERREAFNESLMKLAALIPALETSPQSQLSKHVVVNASIRQHELQMEALATVIAERDALLAEVNQWRSLCGMGDAQVPGDLNSLGAINLPDTVSNLPSLPPLQSSAVQVQPSATAELIYDTMTLYEGMEQSASHIEDSVLSVTLYPDSALQDATCNTAAY